MARKRMFSKDVCEADIFTDLSDKSQLLYYRLNLNADDEGFVDNAKMIMNSIKAKPNHLNDLISIGYVIKFDTKVLIIVHWWVHNKHDMRDMKNTVHSREKAFIVEDKETRIYIYNPSGIRRDSVGKQNSIKEPKIKQDKQTNEGSVGLSVDSIISLLKPEEIESLKSEYINFDGLIALVDDSIRKRKNPEPINNPDGYIRSIAETKQWNLIGYTPSKIPGNTTVNDAPIDGSLWDMLNADNKKLIEGRYANVPELIQAVNRYIEENSIGSLNGSPVSMFSRIAEALEWPYKEEGE